jgi:hypothetical protein
MYERIKAYLGDDTVFFALLIILVGVASFALGRLSVSSLALSSQPVSIILSTSNSESQPVNDLDSDSALTNVVQAESNSGKFVASKNGTKYHLPWCSGAKNIKEDNKIWFIDEPAAKAAGYTPAANCPGL